jgi:hypothetical protein
LTALSALLLVLAVVLLVLNRDLDFRALSPHLFVVPGFAVVGLVLAVRRPGHAIGWLFVSMGLVAAVHAFAFEYAARGYTTAPGSLPAASWMAWLAYWTFLLNLPALALLLLLFPDGRVPSPRWRVVPWLLGVAVAGTTVWTMLQPGPIDLSVLTTANPAGVAALDQPAIQALGNVPGLLAFLTLFVGSVACALAPFVRRRRADPIERQQLKWLALVAGGSGLAGATGFVIVGSANSAVSIVGWLLLVVALVGIAVGIPVAVGLAILRYRLYDIDRLINRTLVYALLTAVLGLGYGGAVLALGQLFGGVGERTPSWVVAGATLAVAALFQPARRRIQTAVDRRFNRRKYNAAKRSRRSAPVCVTRSTSTPSPPSSSRSLTRLRSRPGSRFGFDPPHSVPQVHPAVRHGQLPGPIDRGRTPELTRVEWESIINGCGRSVSRIWSAHRGGQPGLELTDDGAENAGSEQPRPEWT